MKGDTTVFHIRYRLATDSAEIARLSPEEFEDVEGFFQVMAEDNTYGIYFDDMRPPLPWADEYLFLNLRAMLQAAVMIRQHPVVSVMDIEAPDLWLTLHSEGKSILLNAVRAPHVTGDTMVSTRALSPVESLWEQPVKLSCAEFTKEIIRAGKQLRDEICTINPRFVQSKTIIEFSQLIEQTENLLESNEQ